MISYTDRILDYDDYRDVLRDWIASEKAKSRTFSYRYLARRLGLSAPNHMQLVATRQRHLSRATFLKVRPLLKLKARERTAFELLFELGTERDPALRADAAARLGRLRATAPAETADDFALLSNTVAWFVLMGAPLFDGLARSDLVDRILRCVRFPITRVEAEQAVDALLSAGRLTEDKGVLVFPREHVRTGWDLDRNEIKQFHRSNLRLALQAVAFPTTERFLSNVTITADAELVELAKREIRDLCMKLLDASDRLPESARPRQVVAVQFALFPFFTEPC